MLQRLRLTSGLLRLAVVAVALAVAPPQAARAQDAPEVADGGAPVVQSWSLAPTGDDPSQPSTRTSLSYDLDPKGTVEDSVTLWNYSNVQLTFRVYATDALNNADGSFDLIAADEEPVDIGSWVKVPQRWITVPARTQVALPITITVPAGATPGDHSGAIVAESTVEGVDEDDAPVALRRRTGTRLYVRVAGPLEPKLIVEQLAAGFRGSLDPRKGEMDVTYTVRNVGNLRLGATQDVIIKDLFGRARHERAGEEIVELLPGNSITFTEHFDDVAAGLRVTAQIDLRPTGVGTADGDGAAEQVTRSVTVWAPPILLGIVAVVLALAWALYRRLAGAPVGAGGRREGAAGEGRVVLGDDVLEDEVPELGALEEVRR